MVDDHVSSKRVVVCVCMLHYTLFSHEGSKTYQMQSGRDEQVAEMDESGAGKEGRVAGPLTVTSCPLSH